MVYHEARCSGPSERVLGDGNDHIAGLGVGLDEADHLGVPRSIRGRAESVLHEPVNCDADGRLVSTQGNDDLVLAHRFRCFRDELRDPLHIVRGPELSRRIRNSQDDVNLDGVAFSVPDEDVASDFVVVPVPVAVFAGD